MARFAGQQNWHLWGQNQQMDFPNKLMKAHWSRLCLETWQVATKCLVLSKILKLFCSYSAVTSEICATDSPTPAHSSLKIRFLKNSPVEVRMERLSVTETTSVAGQFRIAVLSTLTSAVFFQTSSHGKCTQRVPPTIAGSQNLTGLPVAFN